MCLGLRPSQLSLSFTPEISTLNQKSPVETLAQDCTEITWAVIFFTL